MGGSFYWLALFAFVAATGQAGSLSHYQKQVLHHALDQHQQLLAAEAGVDGAFDDGAQRLLQREIEIEEFFDHARVRLAVQPRMEMQADASDFRDEFGDSGVRVFEIVQHPVQCAARAAVKQMPASVDGREQVGAGMNGLEQHQVVAEIVEQAVLQVRVPLGLIRDGPFEVGETFLGDATRQQCFLVTVVVAIRVEEREVGFADDHVVGRRVVVQLLMPLLHPGAADFLDVVAVHDLENLVADALAVAAAPETREHLADEIAIGGLLRERCSEARGETILRVGQLFRLGIVIALPVELTDRGVAQPDKQSGPGVADIAGFLDQLVTKIEAVHQRPAVRASLAGDDAFLQRGDRQRGGGSLDEREPKIFAAVVLPAVCVRVEQDEHKKARGVSVVETECDGAFAVARRERGLHRLLARGFGLRGPEHFGRCLPLTGAALGHAPVQDEIVGGLEADDDFHPGANNLFLHAEPEVRAIFDQLIKHKDWYVGSARRAIQFLQNQGRATSATILAGGASSPHHRKLFSRADGFLFGLTSEEV